MGCQDFWEWNAFSSLRNKNWSRNIDPREAKIFGMVQLQAKSFFVLTTQKLPTQAIVLAIDYLLIVAIFSAGTDL